MYLLDTNTCLDFLLSRYPTVPLRIPREFGRLNVSMITVAELRVGNKSSADPIRDERNLDSFFRFATPRDFDNDAAAVYGSIVRQIGVRRQSFDRLIAAHAIALGLILVTSNAGDFTNVPGLVMEDWR